MIIKSEIINASTLQYINNYISWSYSLSFLLNKVPWEHKKKQNSKLQKKTLKTRKESQGVTKPWKIYTNFRLIKQNQNFKYCLCTLYHEKE